MQLPRLAFSLLATIVFGAAYATSPYAGQESRAVKALSEQEIKDYLAGKGMGFAKAAELNGYPGPSHVLELADALTLSAKQRARTEAIFKVMQSQAATLGRELVEQERALDRSFAEKSIDPALLRKSLLRIGSLQARIRQAHLDAHLAQAAVLTAEQVARYETLRGYRGQSGNAQHRHDGQHDRNGPDGGGHTH